MSELLFKDTQLARDSLHRFEKKLPPLLDWCHRAMAQPDRVQILQSFSIKDTTLQDEMLLISHVRTVALECASKYDNQSVVCTTPTPTGHPSPIGKVLERSMLVEAISRGVSTPTVLHDVSNKVTLKLLLVESEEYSEDEGRLATLNLYLVHKPGAQLALVPCPGNATTVLLEKFRETLVDVQTAVVRQLKHPCNDYALVWDISAHDVPLAFLDGGSAGAAIALATLYLLKEHTNESIFGSLRRIPPGPWLNFAISAALDPASESQDTPLVSVAGLTPKIKALLKSKQDLGTKVFCARVQQATSEGEFYESYTQPCSTLVDLVSQVADFASRPLTEKQSKIYAFELLKLDVATIRKTCLASSASIINDPDNQAYSLKFNKESYVRRSKVDAEFELMLNGNIAPIMFIKAESGQGKTCFVRDLHDRLADDPTCIPLLIRGLTGRDDQLPLNERIEWISEKIHPSQTAASEDIINAIDFELQAKGIRLVILLDGVNEAKNASSVFNEARQFLMNRLKLARKRKCMTSIRILVTSRPEKYDLWHEENLAKGKIFEALENLIPISRLASVELDGFSDEELNLALHKAGIEETTPHIRRLLADPLLLGFYRNSLTQTKTGQSQHQAPRTPIGIIKAYWKNQLNEILRITNGGTRRTALLIENIKEFCTVLHSSLDAEADVEWGDATLNVLVRDAMVFEQVGGAIRNNTRLRFRYDRVAQLLIAQYVLLEDSAQLRRAEQDFSRFLVQTVIRTKEKGELYERDVLRGSIVTALLLKLEESDTHDVAQVYRLTLGLLDRNWQDYAGLDDTTALACQLSFGEIIFDFFIESTKWHGPSVVSFLESWFVENRSDEKSIVARVLRKVVFCILRNRSSDFGDSGIHGDQVHTQVEMERAVNILQNLGAAALLSDTSGDPAVLLHALYRDGQTASVLEILKLGIDRLHAWPWTAWFRPAYFNGLERVCLAILLLAPEALSDKRFKDCVKDVFRGLPAPLVAMAAAMQTDKALTDNVMPIRGDEWATLAQSHDKIDNFKSVIRLLFEEGWGESDLHLDGPVGAALSLAKSSKNAFVTQLLSHALSCHALSRDCKVRGITLASLGAQVNLLCEQIKGLDSNDKSQECYLGTAAYLLSLVCYHLIVFDSQPRLAEQGRPHLSRDAAIGVFDLMYRLADEVLLMPPLLGKFRHVPGIDIPKETSNIVGTLGRAALELGFSEKFRVLVQTKAGQFAGIAVTSSTKSESEIRSETEFADFLLDSLGTLGSLSADPTEALNCIYAVASEIGLAAFKPIDHGTQVQDIIEIDFKTALMTMPINAMLQIRTIHPFRVEEYLTKRRGKTHAVPFLNHLRYVEPVELTRHLSWVFEQCIERIVAEHPEVVRSVADDALANMSPEGLRIVTARGMLRLGQWAKHDDKKGQQNLQPMVLGQRMEWTAKIAAYLGSLGGPLGTLLAKTKKKKLEKSDQRLQISERSTAAMSTQYP